MRVRTCRRVLTVLVATALMAGACGDDDDDQQATCSAFEAPAGGKDPADSGIAGLESFKVEEALGGQERHTQDCVDYRPTPPVGGPHAPRWRNCGFYGEPVPTEQVVHSLEHGAVWITFRPDLPADQQDGLEAITDAHDYVLVSAFPDLPAPVVASAWGLQVKLDGAADPRLERFVAAYEEGPQSPEPGAPCSGGEGG